MLARVFFGILLTLLCATKAYCAVRADGGSFDEPGDVQVDSESHPLNYAEVSVTESSTLSLTGTGLLNQARIYDTATFLMTGGKISDDDDGALLLSGAANATIHGGEIYSEEAEVIDAADNSTVSISGGVFSTDWAADDSGLSEFDFVIRAAGQSVIEISGGTFNIDPSVPSFTAVEFGEINVYGFGLQINDGVLTGELVNGGELSERVSVAGDGAIHLHNVPEPSSSFLCLIGFGMYLSHCSRRTVHRRPATG